MLLPRALRTAKSSACWPCFVTCLVWFCRRPVRHPGTTGRQRRQRDVEEAIHERFFARDEEALLEDYTEDDEASALGKLAKIARGALRGAAAPDLNPFKQGSNMDATTFKHFLKFDQRVNLV